MCARSTKGDKKITKSSPAFTILHPLHVGVVGCDQRENRRTAVAAPSHHFHAVKLFSTESNLLLLQPEEQISRGIINSDAVGAIAGGDGIAARCPGAGQTGALLQSVAAGIGP